MRSLAALLFAFAIAAPAMAADHELMALPLGSRLIPHGLAEDGRGAAVLEQAADECWSLRVYRAAAGEWRPGTASPPSSGSHCRYVVASASADLGTLLLFTYQHDEGRIFTSGGQGLQPAGRLVLQGEKSFPISPPPGAALSADGRTALLGARNYGCKIGVPRQRCGTAMLYHGGPGGWQQTETLSFPEIGPFNVDYGASVAIFANGEILAVGGPGNGERQGEVYVYEAGQGGYEEVGVLVPDDRSESTFGAAIAGSDDASVVAIAAPPAVYIFGRDSRGWTLFTKITAPDSDAGTFGGSVAVSRDGRRVLVGAPRSLCEGLPRCGAAYLFERAGSSPERWSLLTRIQPPEPRAFIDFGWQVALDRRGTTLAIQGDRTWLTQVP